MGRWSGRISAILFATLFATALPRTALASFPWQPGCPGAGGDRACIYSHNHWTGNVANDNGDNASYQGETWPYSSTNVEDDTSSMKNTYDDLRVKWWEGRNYTGWSLCNQANEGYYNLGLFWSNAISSHDVTGGAC